MPQPTTRKSKRQSLSDAGQPIAGGRLFLHELQSRIFCNTRLVRVWVPPEYVAQGTMRYPVLYLNDGQNLFDPATAFAGVDWQVGETAARLIAAKKIPPLIIVGIDNTGKNRVREYIPYKSLDPRLLRPQGNLYPQFLQKEVMPMIERRYPLLAGPENTGLGGSSLGGLITLYTQLHAPGIFGRLLIESPSLFVANKKILQHCVGFRKWPARVYLGIGTREVGTAEKDEQTVENMIELAGILREAGLDDNRLRVRVDQGAAHNEAAWAGRFPEALEFLFSPSAASISSSPSTKVPAQTNSPPAARRV